MINRRRVFLVPAAMVAVLAGHCFGQTAEVKTAGQTYKNVTQLKDIESRRREARRGAGGSIPRS